MLFTVPWPTGPVVVRPGLTDRVVELLCTGLAGSVGLTAALEGAGGFGKTTAAQEVGWHPRVRGQFTGGVLWVTLGEQVAGAELVGKVNDLARLLSGSAQAFTDVERLAAFLMLMGLPKEPGAGRPPPCRPR